MAQLWQDGKLPSAALVALDGTPLQVVYRGRPNAGPGPDFRDAVLALPDGLLLHGDVELHLRASDFRRHGHDRDPTYNGVILHLVCRADAGPETPLLNGRRARIVAVERWLEARSAEIRAMIEQPALWREPCQSAVERMGAGDVANILARLGERRLRAKAAAMRGIEPAVALYEALLRTLGHGPAQRAWTSLARTLPLAFLVSASEAARERPVQVIEALLLGAAGLLPHPDAATPLLWSDAHLTDARGVWRDHGSPVADPIAIDGPARPANHPARRLAGLARLLAREPLLLPRLRAGVLRGQKPAETLLSMLTVPADGIWQERTLPWGPPARAPAALIGSGKALELALNAALPVLLLMAEQDQDTQLVSAVLQVFQTLPSPPAYGRTAHLFRALRVENKPLIRRASQSQGALHLFAGYCTQGGCGRCPLS